MHPVPHLWPQGTMVRGGTLWIGGCDTLALAAEFGTPLYVFDESTLRGAMAAYRDALAATGLETRVHYAGKALLNTAIAQIVAAEGLGLDVVSGAELLLARHAGVPMARVHLHGNAKSDAELRRALEWGVGAIVADSLDEIERLAALAPSASAPQGVLLRIAPAIEAHTHSHIATGGAGSKFGLPLGALDLAARRVLAAPRLRLLGLHAHIGSQLFELGELRTTVEVLVREAAGLHRRYGLTIEELSPGGGLGVAYTAEQLAPDVVAYARELAGALRASCAAHGLPLPRLTVEPGRSVVARAGVALYRVVGRKLAPDGQVQFLHVDGGMADNIRPSLYGARYTALLASRAAEPAGPPVDVAGRYCESGDVLLRDAHLPPASPGDLLAVAAAGAYTLSMASTYNMVPRPAVVLVAGGHARLVQRRETEEDLLARDLPL
ncbi:MAG: diaminopimelate decarboxylase [Chloroflexi bacterium OHK40]